MLSFPENIPQILRAVYELQPKKILDVGPGMGKYGLLIREQDISCKVEKAAIEKQEDLCPVSDLVIECCEDTEYFLNGKLGNTLYSIYDRVIPESIFNIMDIISTKKYDVVMMIDTVEHWKKDDAIELLRHISDYSAIVVSTPIRTGMYQDHLYGDQRHHITQFEVKDFTENFNGCRFFPSRFSHIVIIPKKL
jgi:hypothetical protein